MEPARRKYGLLLATGRLGWDSTREVGGGLWRRFTDRMASCEPDVVNHNGARALCWFMYTEHGFAIPTLHDGGIHKHHREVATQLWERLAKRQTVRSGLRQAGAMSGWPTVVKATNHRAIWCKLVRALPLGGRVAVLDRT